MDKHKDGLEWPHAVTKVPNSVFLTPYILTSNSRPIGRLQFQKSLEENSLMRKRNSKVIVKSKQLGTRKLRIFINTFSQPILQNDILRQE